jgi:single-strand DNA-binding protein
MNSLNSILIEGNLTRDPVLATTPRGTPVCNFSIASNRFYKQDDETQKEVSFFDIEVWAKLAESCGQRLTKGRGVRVVGRLKQDRWADTEGRTHNRVKIVGEHVEFRPVFQKKEEETATDGKDPTDTERYDETDESMEKDAVVAEPDPTDANGTGDLRRSMCRAERDASPVDALAEVTII